MLVNYGISLGICALDCLVDDPNPNADTRGLITNNVSDREESYISLANSSHDSLGHA